MAKDSICHQMVASIANIAEYDMNMNMNKQVEMIEKGSVEVSSKCEPLRLIDSPTVEVGNVEASVRVEGGNTLPVEVGRVSLYSSAHSARSVEDIDISRFLHLTVIRALYQR